MNEPTPEDIIHIKLCLPVGVTTAELEVNACNWPISWLKYAIFVWIDGAPGGKAEARKYLMEQLDKKGGGR